MAESFSVENQQQENESTHGNSELLDSRVDVSDISNIENSDNSSSFNPDSRVDISESNNDVAINDPFDLDQRISVDESALSREEMISLQDSSIATIEQNPLTELDSAERGNYGEMKVDQDMRNRGYVRQSIDMILDINSDLKQGIDGVYYKNDGEPAFVILEVKFNKSELGMTQDGKQMSMNWIDKRLDDAVGREKAKAIRKEMLLNPDNVGTYVARVNLEGNVSYSKLDSNANVVERNCNLYDKR